MYEATRGRGRRVSWCQGVAVAGAVLLLLLVACSGAQGAVQQPLRATTVPVQPPWTFDTIPSAGLPPGADPFSGAWGVRVEDGAPSPPNALCQAGSGRDAALSLGDATYADAVLSARLKLISGRTGQAAGLLFRIQDKDNYYVLGADVLEKRVRLYKYAAGRLTAIQDGSAAVTTERWQLMRIEATGNRFRGFLDDQMVVEAVDDALPAGRVGLWTKADSITCFDDVDVKTSP